MVEVPNEMVLILQRLQPLDLGFHLDYPFLMSSIFPSEMSGPHTAYKYSKPHTKMKTLPLNDPYPIRKIGTTISVRNGIKSRNKNANHPIVFPFYLMFLPLSTKKVML